MRATIGHPRALAVVLSSLATTGLALAQQATLVGTLNGHTDRSTRSPGAGRQVAGDGGLRQHGQAVGRGDAEGIRTLEGHAKLVLAVAFSPDGKQLLSGSLDNSAKIWDLPASGPASRWPATPPMSRPSR